MGTRKYYIASIAVQQTATAASSSGTYGFSAGISLDVEGSKTKNDTSNTTSLASNIKANNILIQTKQDTNNQTTISGSTIEAKQNLDIKTKDLNIISSIDTNDSKTDRKDISGSISMTVYGASTGSQVSLGYGEQHNSLDSLRNNNSQINAKNINITTSNDTNIKGANINAQDELNLNVGNDLNIESQRDTYNSNSKGFNVSVGFGFGTDSKLKDNQIGGRTSNGEVTNANGAYGVNKGRTKVKETVLTSVTGNNVNVTVGNNTNLKGSLLAAGKQNENGEFIDNSNLTLDTKTLTYQNSSNIVYEKNKSFNVGINTSIGKDNKGNTNISADSSSLNFSKDSTFSKTKTLATLGKGNITIKDEENSDDITRLNRDTENSTKEIYDVKTGVKIDMTLDHHVVKNVENLVMSIKLISKTIETTNKIANALKELKKNDPEKYEATILVMDEYNKNLAKQSNQSSLLPALAISPLVGELLISAGVITGTVVTTQKARNNSVNGIIGNEVGSDYKDSYHVPPKDISDIFPNAQPVKNKNQRQRWVDSKTGEIYEWDYQHGDIEIYNKRGKHKGSINPKTKKEKPAVNGRKTNN